ncbi:hypothetical protein V2P20_03680 [Methylobacter sp. Wu1]|uniref:hypothetical protein n=1 Tax=Methylobacter sp. Wu1 TaxID=3119359 RepID=UPI002F924DFB
MTALAKDRNTPQREGDQFVYGVAASTKIYAGSLVCVNASGYAVPGSVATTLKVVGRAEEQVDNSAGADGAKTITVRRGTFKFANAGDVTIAHLETNIYINDDQTVSSVSTGKSVAGKCVGVDADGVWIKI